MPKLFLIDRLALLRLPDNDEPFTASSVRTRRETLETLAAHGWLANLGGGYFCHTTASRREAAELRAHGAELLLDAEADNSFIRYLILRAMKSGRWMAIEVIAAGTADITLLEVYYGLHALKVNGLVTYQESGRKRQPRWGLSRAGKRLLDYMEPRTEV